MKQERIPLGEASAVALHNIAGSLDIHVAQERELWVRTSGDLQVDHAGDTITLSCTGDCTLTLPADIRVQWDNVRGHAHIQGVTAPITGNSISGHLQIHDTGPIQVQIVSGHLQADNTGPIQVHAVHGHLHARQVAGDLLADHVDGDLRADDVQGQVKAAAGGNLVLRNIDGAVQAEGGGDARLKFALAAETPYAIRAGGNILCRLPADTDAAVHLRCGGRIRVQGPIGLQPEAAGVLQFVLGEGAGSLDLTAGGDIRVFTQWAPGDDTLGDSPLDDDMRQEFARQTEQAAQAIATQLEDQILSLARQLETKLNESGAGEEIAARVQEKVQTALRRAENNIANALRHVEKQAQRAENRAARAEARQQRHRPVWPEPPAPRPAPVSPEQRMQVLRMLEEGKISVEQAEQLLAALGDKVAQA